ncbi:sugar-binding transcriptional regulator [Clostridium sp. BJN0001]|uniref:sugar-binding transcriptional regulator n=1 Tax=Clostridium sp. BJN0001 TaxID=2930219 RepID=UPI001FD1AFDF|nr:sugar-binding transcriptional regulator [Clostridium sp. BJN0001]
MAIYDNNRLVIKVCKLFYENNMNQKEISVKLGISKPQVCRMITYAKENNIVKFTIDNPYTHEFSLEENLIKKYSLKEAFVFNINYKNESEAIEKLGKCCAKELDKYFKDNSTIGVMSGRTISAVSNYAHRLTRKGLVFVPLIGNPGTRGHNSHANIIAENFAKKTGGSYLLLNAPLRLQNKKICEIIKSEPSISEVLKKGASCDISLIGIGEISPSSTSYICGAFNECDIKNLKKHNAVSSVCTSYISDTGEIIKNDLSECSIGISLDKLSKSTTIAVSTNLEKLNSIKAALKSGYIDVFMTSLDIAEKLIK